MATLSSGDTLSLNNLATATDQSTKSMGTVAGSTATPISMSAFAIDAVGSLSGFTYVVENTSENYTLGFTSNMSDANYCGVPGGHTTNANDFSTQHIYLTEPATSTLRIKCNDSGGSAADWTLTTALVQGDLA